MIIEDYNLIITDVYSDYEEWNIPRLTYESVKNGKLGIKIILRENLPVLGKLFIARR